MSITKKDNIMNKQERIENFKKKYKNDKSPKIKYVKHSDFVKLEKENRDLKDKIMALEETILSNDEMDFQDLGR